MWLRWRVVRRKRLVRRRGRLAGTTVDYQAHKEQTRQLVKQRLAYFNRIYGFTFQRIAIKNSATRWGSCSKAGNLNFHYKVGLLPPELADYVIVHELCHLQELNHSKQFWTLVRKTIPHYQQCRQQLRRQPNWTSK